LVVLTKVESNVSSNLGRMESRAHGNPSFEEMDTLEKNKHTKFKGKVKLDMRVGSTGRRDGYGSGAD